MTRNGRTDMPGTRLLAVARALFSAEKTRALFEPAIADLQHEWRQTAPGSWQRRLTLFRAYRAYLRLLLVAPFAGRTLASSTAPHGSLLAVVNRRNDDALGKVLLMWALLLASMWSLFGSFVFVLAAGALATAAVLHQWHCRHAEQNGVGSGALPGRPEINFAAIPVYGKVLPTIVLAVAAFLLNLVVSRLIAVEREQIGLLKAFGYGNVAVGWHYLKMVVAMASLGLLVGLAVGAWLGRTLTVFYAEVFRFPFLFYRPSLATYAGAALLSLGAAVLGTLSAVRRAVVLPPAEAMIPPPPPVYRRGLSGFRLGALIDQPSRMILRHVVRWPARSALTTLGIAMAVAVMVSSLHWLDAIEHMVEVQFFEMQRQDATVSLVEPRGGSTLARLAQMPGVMAAEPFRSVPVRFRLGHLERREAITGIPAEVSLQRVLDAGGAVVELPEDGLVLSAALADLIGASPGDRVTVEVMEGRRPTLSVEVAAVFDNYLGTPAYMDIRALNRLMLEGPTISGAYLLVDGRDRAALYRQLKDTPAVAAVTLRAAAIGSFRDTMAETIVFIVTFYISFGGLLAFGVLYNSARIALSERARELASLRVLGFTRFEVSYILLGELLLLTLVALPLGCAIGYLLSWAMSEAMQTELYRVPLLIGRPTYGVSVLAVVVAALASCAIVRWRIDRLDLIEVLKTRE
jgi:putative ABC transport system permease protein